MVELTEEQLERMRKNREKALEIRKRIQEEKERNEQKENSENNRETKRQKVESEEAVELERFEEGASEYVNKADAMKMYCLPEGTLAVCEYVEKQNPRHKSWTPMKLYKRAEIRRRARERWGGLEGLAAERRRREEAKYEKDLEKTKNVFKSKKK